MDEFLQWLVSNTVLATFLIASAGLLLVVIAISYIVAFRQGRKVTFWPPSIGERPSSSHAAEKKSDEVTNTIPPNDKVGSHKSGYVISPIDKNFGLVEIYNMQEQDQQNKRNVDTKQIIMKGNTFHLLALSAVSYIDPGIKRHWEYMRPKLENGVPFYLLLLDPFNKEKKFRDKLNKIGSSFDPKFRLDLLINLYNTYPNVSIRIAKQNIYCSIFFSDKEMIYDPYHMGRVGDRLENNFFNIRIENLNSVNDYYLVLNRHFEYLWSMSDEFETFVENHSSDLLPSHKRIKVRSRMIG